jgi:hypothetical protein
MARHAEKNPKVEVGDAAKRVARRVSDLGWPKGCEPQLPAAAQVFMDAQRGFLNKLHEFLGRQGMIAGLRLLAVEAREQLSPTHAEHRAQLWLAGVNRRVKKYAKFDGNLLAPYLLWTPTCAEAMADGRGWAESRGHKAELWDKLMGELGC